MGAEHSGRQAQEKELGLLWSPAVEKLAWVRNMVALAGTCFWLSEKGIRVAKSNKELSTH